MAKILSKVFSKQYRKWTLTGIAVLIVGFFGVRYVVNRRNALPKGIASGNGRIESKEVDVAAKLPLRVKAVLVSEGDLVKPGQVVVKMDTVTLEAELAEAEASLAAAQEQLTVAKAGIFKQRSEIELAQIEKARSGRLVAERAGSQRELDVRTMRVKTTSAGLAEAKGKLQVAKEQVDVARANVAKVQSQIDDATLTSPVMGRVLYRVAEPGEVLPAGGKVLTLVNLEDVYMEIFLPSDQAAAIKNGAEARIKVDFDPNRAAAGYVSFVSPEAQFTPKEVETKSEREKLMFRVKIQVPRELVLHYIERIKTGVRGVGYVKVADNAVWPSWLQKDLIKPSDLPQQEHLPAGAAQPAPQPR
jgi:HlyD family secretion protein